MQDFSYPDKNDNFFAELEFANENKSTVRVHFLEANGDMDVRLFLSILLPTPTARIHMFRWGKRRKFHFFQIGVVLQIFDIFVGDVVDRVHRCRRLLQRRSV